MITLALYFNLWLQALQPKKLQLQEESIIHIPSSLETFFLVCFRGLWLFYHRLYFLTTSTPFLLLMVMIGFLSYFIITIRITSGCC